VRVRYVPLVMHWIPALGGQPVCGTGTLGPNFSHNTDQVTCLRCIAWFPEWYVYPPTDESINTVEDLPF
jgi:hypothetical protein